MPNISPGRFVLSNTLCSVDRVYQAASLAWLIPEGQEGTGSTFEVVGVAHSVVNPCPRPQISSLPLQELSAMDSGPNCDDYFGEKLVPCKMSENLSVAASGSASSNTSQVPPEQSLRWAALLRGLPSCQASCTLLPTEVRLT